jgi:hypothetical protein
MSPDRRSPRRSRTTLRRAAMLVATVGLLAATGACAGTSRALTLGNVGIVGDLDTLNADTPLALDVSNRLGTVIIDVSPQWTEPLVQAVWLDGPGAGVATSAGAATRQDLRPQWTAADLVTENGRATLRVMHADTDENDPARRVALTIRVPRCDGLRVRNAGGPVEVRGVAGAVTIENATSTLRPGPAPVRLRTSADLVDPVALTTDAGELTLEAGGGTRGRLQVQAPAGSFSLTDLGGGVRTVTDRAGQIAAVVNGGDSPIILSTPTGPVRVVLGQELSSR